MLNHPHFDPRNPLLNKNPLDLKFIHGHQQKDMASLKALQEDHHFTKTNVKNIPLLEYKHGPSSEKRIVIPQDLQYPVIRWLYSILGHVGISRMSNLPILSKV